MYVVVRADWRWTRKVLEASGVAWVRDTLLSGPYDDLSAAWYKDVGFAIIGIQFGTPLVNVAWVAVLKVYAAARRVSGSRFAVRCFLTLTPDRRRLLSICKPHIAVPPSSVFLTPRLPSLRS